VAYLNIHNAVGHAPPLIGMSADALKEKKEKKPSSAEVTKESIRKMRVETARKACRVV
jgi:hypothetical protein